MSVTVTGGSGKIAVIRPLVVEVALSALHLTEVILEVVKELKPPHRPGRRK